ncbi:unnamed protein product [Commensalibacter communis]|uniref:Hint domain-containing protein n=1 Tax=Commensalibacter communis TaxID=2972786 RepID=UPI0022FF6E44|nr:Hint domain-containing protein [Commensalibacter communis]CAI3959346.1 unnamed protein product [Commensalibacter communis]
MHNGNKIIKKITSILNRQITVSNKDQLPIRILKSAFAENIPYEDLLITPEHCVFIKEQLVPVRMLVNGRSIIQDTSFNHYDVYHFETEEHSIIIANGVLTESYLNTDVQCNNFLTVKGKKSWEDAAAPLNTTRAFVEKIYNDIEKRSKLQNLLDTRVKPKLTNDHGLYLTTPDGQKLTMIYEKNNYIAFRLPPNINFVTIHSLSSRLSETIGPFVDDRRQLGILIENITLSDFYDTLEIDTHLNIKDLLGWSVQEQTRCRWTLGRAILPLNRRNSDTIGILRMKVIAGGPYIIQDNSHLPLKAM